MQEHIRTNISCRLFPELKKELQEEAAFYELTLSRYLEWILENRSEIDNIYLFWLEEKEALLNRIKLLETVLRAFRE